MQVKITFKKVYKVSIEEQFQKIIGFILELFVNFFFDVVIFRLKADMRNLGGRKKITK